MTGWIKLHRELINNSTITKDAEYFAVYIYLLCRATYESLECYYGGKKIALEAGQVILCHKDIYEVLKIEPTKLRRILKSFKNDGLIDYQTNRHETLITLTLWGDYQGKNAEQNAEPMPNQCRSVKEGENEKEKRTKREKEKEREIYKKERKIDVCVEGETHTEKKALLGKYENVLVDRKWLEDFKAKYSYWGEVVESLSRYKAAKGITNARDEPYLESFAQQDRERYAKRTGEVESSFDADEFFEAALARSYAQMEDL